MPPLSLSFYWNCNPLDLDDVERRISDPLFSTVPEDLKGERPSSCRHQCMKVSLSQCLIFCLLSLFTSHDDNILVVYLYTDPTLTALHAAYVGERGPHVVHQKARPTLFTSPSISFSLLSGFDSVAMRHADNASLSELLHWYFVIQKGD